ncbi:tetratricopeptide repeat protein [Paenirhodobacter sp.]|uniref:tetratricopeptide repeat protein n=1 Tax=Paenirhodobacter sp. TaxID=1965326 RepID=UPI003B510A42
MDVLGRGASFEPSLDPIVRIEISRLRSALEAYYATYGRESSVSIELPRGRYAVRFVASGNAAVTLPQMAVPEPPLPVRPEPEAPSAAAPRRPSLRRWLWPVAVACLAAATLALLLLRLPQGSPDAVAPPTVQLTLSVADPAMAGRSEALRDYLMAAMLRFGTVRIADPAAARPASDYRVEITYSEAQQGRSARWALFDNRSRHLVSAGVEDLDARGIAPEFADRHLAAVLAVRLTDMDGVIAGAEMERAPAGALGNVCILRASHALELQDWRDIGAAQKCLEETASADPENARAVAYLSMLSALKGNDPSLERAEALAEQAMSIDPTSDAAELALARSRFARGHLDTAIVFAQRALATNPYNADTAGALAVYFFSRGEWGKADAMVGLASRYKRVAPADAILVRSLNSFRNQDWASAAQFADEILSLNGTARVVRAAALAKLEFEQGRSSGLEELYRRYPELPRDGEKLIQSQLYRPEFSASLEDGFARASSYVRDAGTPY